MIRAQARDWIILRPVLVLSPRAYGGTALLRAAAAVPWIAVDTMPDTPVQVVHVGDVAHAVVQAARGEIAPGTQADLTEPGTQSFADLTDAMRAWLGYPAWRRRICLPTPVLWLIARVADGLGWLGWRSPLRSAALTSLRDGVTGDPARWAAAGGRPCRSLDATLTDIPATQQDRWFGRMFLALPVIIATLALFWGLSGARPDAAKQVLTARGWSAAPALAFVIGGALIDIALGLGILWRRWSRAALIGMIATSCCAYLAGATLWAPDLWADPLGPLDKMLPQITLALIAMALIDPR